MLSIEFVHPSPFYIFTKKECFWFLSFKTFSNTTFSELEERKKKQERRLEELRLTIIQNSEELQKLKLQDEQIAGSTFEAQEKEKILKQELKRKGGLIE